MHFLPELAPLQPQSNAVLKKTAARRKSLEDQHVKRKKQLKLQAAHG
jgi:hypothetical protein